MTYSTNYRVATQWCNNSLILCNKVTEDETIYENANFDWEEVEIFQFYLTNCTVNDVDYLSEHFGLLFTYSDALDLYVLCVPHYGTSWDYVYCETDNEYAACELGQSK